MSLTIQSGGSITLQGGSGGGGAISAVNSATCPGSTVTAPATYQNTPTVASVTLTTGTSAVVTIDATVMKTGTTVGPVYTNPLISFAVSGASTIAASDVSSTSNTLGAQYEIKSMSRTLKVTGLTPGSNTFALQYRADGTDKNIYFVGDITVMALA